MVQRTVALSATEKTASQARLSTGSLSAGYDIVMFKGVNRIVRTEEHDVVGDFLGGRDDPAEPASPGTHRFVLGS